MIPLSQIIIKLIYFRGFNGWLLQKITCCFKLNKHGTQLKKNEDYGKQIIR